MAALERKNAPRKPPPPRKPQKPANPGNPAAAAAFGGLGAHDLRFASFVDPRHHQFAQPLAPVSARPTSAPGLEPHPRRDRLGPHLRRD